MNLLPPLPIMEKWRLEGLSPQEIKAQADLWVKEARRALRQPPPPKPKPKPTLTLGSVTGLKPGPVPGTKLKPGPRPGIPKRFPPRPKDGRSKPAKDGRSTRRKLPDLETLVELYQTHTMQEIADMYQAGASSVGAHLQKTDAVARKRQARKEARKQKQQQQPSASLNLKLPNVEQLEELYKTHSLREIGAMYGACAEAVRHHLRKVGAIERKRANKEAADLERIREMRGQGASWDKMAKTLHRSAEYLRKLAEEAGMETAFKMTLVCSECDRNPYAKGLCRRCYEWVRRNKGSLSPEQQVKARERAAMAKGPGKYRRGLRPETLERMRRIQGLREQGKTFKQIYTETGIHGSTACALLKRYERYIQQQQPTRLTTKTQLVL